MNTPPPAGRTNQPNQSGTGSASPADTAKAEASRTAEDFRKQGEDLANTAKEQARGFARDQKDAGADQIHGVANAVNKAADELERSSPELARYARQAASSVDEFSSALRERSVGDLAGRANDFARREPMAFFGAAMVAGFAISRFLKSSENRPAPSPAQAGGSYPPGETSATRSGSMSATSPSSAASPRPGAPNYSAGTGRGNPMGR